ncbi:cadherin-like domain-containing protein [Magnetococcus sp. PR-3]|uniref:cadherin-like domain-containing protein n=1 Tax=Magnetococcus sp. PR-3 TaxID=3120355 RepID=UPI002FCDF489
MKAWITLPSLALDLATMFNRAHDAVLLPDAHFLTEGRFERDGADLVIQKTDGTQHRVSGYFDRDTPPPLALASGVTLTPEMVMARLMAPEGQGSFVAQQDGGFYAKTIPSSIIGTVDELSGRVVVRGSNGSLNILQEGDPIYIGDLLESAHDSAIKIRFVDETLFQLGAQARFHLDTYIYDPSLKQGQFGATVYQGMFRYASGGLGQLHGQQHTLIKTPSAMIGVHGSELRGEVTAEGTTTVVHTSGILTISDVYGQGSVTLLQPTEATTVAFTGGPPKPVFRATAAIVQQLQQALPSAPLPKPDQTERDQGNLDERSETDEQAQQEGEPEAPDLDQEKPLHRGEEGPVEGEEPLTPEEMALLREAGLEGFEEGPEGGPEGLEDNGPEGEGEGGPEGHEDGLEGNEEGRPEGPEDGLEGNEEGGPEGTEGGPEGLEGRPEGFDDGPEGSVEGGPEGSGDGSGGLGSGASVFEDIQEILNTGGTDNSFQGPEESGSEGNDPLFSDNPNSNGPAGSGEEEGEWEGDPYDTVTNDIQGPILLNDVEYLTGTPGSAFSYTFQFADNSSPFLQFSTEDLPTWLTATRESDTALTISGTIDANQTESVVLSITAMDGSQNTLTHTETLRMVLSGNFVDSAVEGVNFSTSSGQTGTTDTEGTFTYLSGSDTITFTLGGVTLGSGAADSDLTPTDLVADASNYTDGEVTNILRFLQTLDSDKNPDNGITIDETMRTIMQGKSFDLSQDELFADGGEFYTLMWDNNRTVVSATEAQKHHLKSLSSVHGLSVDENLPTLQVDEGQLFEFDAAGIFTHGQNKALTYEASLAKGSALPSWLSFNTQTGAFSGVPVDKAHTGSFDLYVTALDGSETIGGANLTLDVKSVNDDPVVENLQNWAVTQGALVTLTSDQLSYADEEQSADELIYTIESKPEYGDLLLDGNILGERGETVQSITFSQQDINHGRIHYAHDLSATDISDTITLTLSDGAGYHSASFNLDISILSTDQPILTANQPVAVAESGSITIQGASQGSSADLQASGQSSELLFTITELPSSGQLYLDGTLLVLGTNSTFTHDDLDAGLLSYQHDSSHGEIDHFDFYVTDTSNGLTSSPSAVVFKITTSNDDPSLAINKALTLQEGGTRPITPNYLSAIDEEQSSSELVYTLTSLPSAGGLILNSSALEVGGTFTQADLDSHTLLYTHAGGHIESDSFNYTLEDSAGGVVVGSFNVTISTVNDDPSLSVGTSLQVAEAQALTITDQHWLVVDEESDSSLFHELIYTLKTPPSYGVIQDLTGDIALNGTFTHAQLVAGDIQYVHGGGEESGDSLSVELVDAEGGTVSHTFDLEIVAVNDAPQLLISTDLSVITGSVVSLLNTQLSASDAEQLSSALTYKLGAQPLAGDLLRNGVTLLQEESFTQADVDAGLIQYQHDASLASSDTLMLTLSDGDANLDVSFTLSVTATAPDSKPYLTLNDSLGVDEGSVAVLANTVLMASDADQADVTTLIYQVLSLPTAGTLLLNGTAMAVGEQFTQAQLWDEDVSYQHQGSQNSRDSFQFEVLDSSSQSSGSHLFLFSVNTLNDAPQMVTNSGGSVAEAGALTLSSTHLLASDEEQDALTLTYTLSAIPSQGSLSLDGTSLDVNGTFTQLDLNGGRVVYQHHGEESAQDFFTFTVSDGVGGNLDTDRFDLSIIAQNDAPILSVPTHTDLQEEQVLTLTVDHLNASDEESVDANLSITLTSVPSQGVLTLDGSELLEGASFTLGALQSGRVVYEHGGGEITQDHLDFSVADAAGETDEATWYLNIQTFNDNPYLFTHKSLTVEEGHSGAITHALLQAKDEEQLDTDLTYTLKSLPVHGDLTLGQVTLDEGDVLSAADLAGGSFTYTHDDQNSTTDGFDITLGDGVGGTLDVHFTITILPLNDPPVIQQNNGLLVSEGATNVTLSNAQLLAIDGEQDHATLAYIIESAAEYGTFALNGVSLSAGDSFTQEQLDAGLVTYSHHGGELSSDAMGFKVYDGTNDSSGYSGSATFSITVSPVDDPPVIEINSGFTVTEGRQDRVIGSNLLSATDADNDALQVIYTLTTLPVSGTLKLDGTVLALEEHFTQADINSGLLTYSHDGSASESDSIGFSLEHLGEAVVTGQVAISITTVNDPPTLDINTSVGVDEEGQVTLSTAVLSASDVEQTATELSYIVTALPLYGEIRLNGSSLSINGAFTQAELAAGEVSYHHNGSETTADSFSFTLSDGDDGALTGQSVALVVTAVNDAPQLSVNSGLTVSQGASLTAITGTMLNASDVEQSAASLTFTLSALPAQGTLSLSGSDLVVGSDFTVADILAGSLGYTHDGGSVESDQFTFQLTDDDGGSRSGSFDISIDVTNYPPILSTNSGLTVLEGSLGNLLTAAVLEATDSQQTVAELTYTLTALPVYGTLVVTGQTLVVGDNFTQEDVEAGLLSYSHNGAEVSSDTFQFTIQDGAGGSLAASTFNFAVTALNDAPVVSPGSVTGTEELAYSFAEAVFSVLYSDAEGDAFTHIRLENLPSHGTLNLGETSVVAGQEIAVNLLSGLSYTPQTDFSGQDHLSWSARDGTLFGQAATLSINISNINDAPSVVDFTVQGQEDIDLALNQGVFASGFNDVDGDLPEHITISSLTDSGTLLLSESAVTVGQSMTASELANLIFRPEENWSGSTSFTWTGADAALAASGSATATLTLSASNDLPTLSDLTISGDEDQVIPFSQSQITALLSDVDGDSAQSMQILTLPGNGTLALGGSAVLAGDTITASNLDALTFTPNSNWYGTESFTFNLSDGQSYAASSGTITLTVQSVSDAVSAVDDWAATSSAIAVAIDSWGNDIDQDNAAVMESFTQGSLGTVSHQGNGIFTFTPDGSSTGLDSFTYTVGDGAGASDTATVRVMLYDNQWSGAISTGWNSSGNWSSGALPTSSSSVYISSAASDQPILNSNVTLRSLLVGSQATLTATGYTVTATGDVIIEGALSGGTLSMTGSNALVGGNINALSVSGTVTATQDISLDAGLSVNQGYTFTLGGQHVTTGSDVYVVLSTIGTGLRLVNAEDVMVIGGNVTFTTGYNQDSANSSGNFSAGTLHVRGDFSQFDGSYSSSNKSFVSTGTAVVLDGSSAQTVYFQDPGSSYFKDLVVSNAAGVTLTSSLYVTGQLTMSGSGVLSQNSGLHLYVTNHLPITNSGYQLVNTRVAGVVTMDRDASIPNGGHLYVDEGRTLTLNGQELLVDGSLVVTLNAIVGSGLVMTHSDDTLTINGGLTAITGYNQDAASSSGNLTAGTIYLRGNFSQYDGSYSSSNRGFVSTGTTVYLDGTSAQTVYFQDPGSSYFDDLIVSNSAGVTLTSTMYVLDQLTMSGGGQLTQGSGYHLYVTNHLPITSSGYHVTNTRVAGHITMGVDATLPNAGNLYIDEGRTLTMDGHALTIDGALVVTLNGTAGSGLIVGHADDVVIVEGAATFSTGYNQDSANSSGNFSQGELHFRGNFTQSDGSYSSSNKAFVQTGGTVYLDGDSVQSIYFADPGHSYFKDVTVSNSVGVNLTSNLYVTGQLTMSGSGLLTQNSGLGVYYTAALPVTNDSYQISNNYIDGTFTMDRDATLPNGGHLTILEGDGLTIGGHTLTVAGTLASYGSGGSAPLVMQSTEDVVVVEGSALFSTGYNQDAANSTGQFSAGTLYVRGNFTQSDGSYSSSNRAFVSTGTKVVLDGDVAQSVYFQDGHSSYSRFDDLQLDNQSGITFTSNIYVGGDLLLAGTTPFSASGTLTVAGDVKLTGQNVSLDMGALDSSDLVGVTTIDLTGTGDNTLILDAQDVIDLSPTDQVMVTGALGDLVNAMGSWSNEGQEVVDSLTYTRYSSGAATLLVQDGVVVSQLGTVGDDSLTLNSGDDPLLGGSGNDQLDGGSGQNILRGGLGDDLIVFDSADTTHVDGGLGRDTLRIDSSSADLTTLAGGVVTGFETLLLNGSSGTTLTLDESAVAQLPDGGSTLTVDVGGGSGHRVVAGDDWISTGVSQEGAVNYVLYSKNGSTLKIDATIQRDFSDSHWLGSVDQQWSVADNWVNTTIPAAGAGVTIDAGQSTLATGTADLNHLVVHSGGHLTVDGGVLKVADPSLISSDAQLTLSSGSLDGAGTLTVDGLFNLKGGTISGTGGVVVAGVADLTNSVGASIEGTLTLEGTGTLNATEINGSGVLTNRGSTSVTGSANLGVAVTNSGHWVLQADGGVVANLDGSGGVTNTGTLQSAGSGTTPNILEGDLINSGVLDVDYDLQVGGAGHTVTSSSGELDLAASTTLTVTQGTLALGSGTQLSGAGTLEMAGSSILSLTSQYTHTGTVDLDLSGSVTVSGANLVNQAVINLDGGDDTFTNTLVNDTAGLLVFVGRTGEVADPLFSSGFSNLGTLRLTDDVAGGASSGFSMATGQSFENSGTVISQSGVGGGSRIIEGQINNSGTLQVDHALTLAGTDTAHVSGGLLDVNADLTLTQTTSGSFSHSGTVDLASGTTLLVQGGAFHNAGGILQGAGTLKSSGATLNHNGTLQAGGQGGYGTLTIDGDVALGSGSDLRFELGGTVAGTDHDQLDVIGTVTAGGTLTVDLGEGYTPVNGQTYTLLTFDGWSGTFDSYDLLLDDSRWTAVVTHNSDHLLVTTTHAPLTLFDVFDNAGAAQTLTVTSNDSDADSDLFTITSITDPSHGTASIDAGAQTLTYTADSGYSGNDSLTYTVTDTYGATDTQTVHISGNVSWTNALGSGDWHSGGNWNSGVAAHEGDHVTLTSQGGSVTFSTGAFSIDHLTSAEDLTLTGGTLSVSGATTFESGSTLTLSGGNLGGEGAITLNGDLSWNSGSLTGNRTLNTLGSSTLNGGGTRTTGVLTWNNSGALSFNGASISGGGTLNSSGDVSIKGTNSLALALLLESAATMTLTSQYYNSSVLNAQGGLTNQGHIILTDNSYGGAVSLSVGSETLVNQGTLQSITGTNSTARTISGVLTNSGVLDIDHTLTLSGGDLTNTGSVDVDAAFNFSDHTFDLTSGSMDIATGKTVTLSNATLLLSGSSQLSGEGVLQLNGTSTLSFSSATTLHASLNLNLAGTVTLSGSAVSNTGSMVFYGGDDVVNLSLNNTGTVTLRSQYYDGVTVTVNADMVNSGLIEFTDNSYGGSTAFAMGSGYTLANSGTVRSSYGSNGTSRYMTGDLANSGTLDVDHTLNYSAGNLTNTGVMDLDAALNISVSGYSVDTTAGSIDIASGQTLTQTDGTLVVGSGTTLSGDGSLVLTGSAQLSSLSAFELASGGPTLNLAGTNAFTGSTLTNSGHIIAYGGDDTFQNTLVNTGTLTLRSQYYDAINVTLNSSSTNSGVIELTDNSYGGFATLTIAETQSLTNLSGGTVKSSYGTNGTARTIQGDVINQGTLDIDHTLTFTTGDVTNTGLMDVDANLNLQNGTLDSSSGSLDIASGKTFTLTNSTVTLGSGTTMSGSGSFTLASGAALNLASSYNHAGVGLNLSGATTISGSGLSVSGDVYSYGGDDTFDTTVSNSGAFTVRSQYYDAITTTFNQGITNSGSFEMTDNSYGGAASVVVASGYTFTNQSSGTLTISKGSNSTARTINGQLDNQGTMDINHTLALSMNDAQHSNSGTIYVNGGNWNLTLGGTSGQFTNSGTIDIGSGYSVTVTGGSFTNEATGIISGAGSFNSSGTTLVNHGTISAGNSPGSLTIEGDLLLGQESTLLLELQGQEPGISYDLLTVTGALTLGGTLVLDALEGYLPDVGTVFTPLVSGGMTGAFDALQGWRLSDDRVLDVEVGHAEIVLTTRQATQIANAVGETLTGTTEDDVLLGGMGDDILQTAGGADLVHAGAGDDQIHVIDGGFKRVDGGAGVDTLLVEGELDLTALDHLALENIEEISLQTEGTDTLTLDAVDLLSMTDDLNQILIRGDEQDQVDLVGTWQQQSQQQLEEVRYNHYVGQGGGTLLVEDGIQIDML